MIFLLYCFFFFQAEDGIRYLVRSRGLGDVYKRQPQKVVQSIEIAGKWAGQIRESSGTTYRLALAVDLSLIHI